MNTHLRYIYGSVVVLTAVMLMADVSHGQPGRGGFGPHTRGGMGNPGGVRILRMLPPMQVRRRLTGPDIAQHKTLEDRIAAASQCLEGLKLTLPTLIDSMDNAAHTAYGVRAAAMAIIDLDAL